MWLCTNLLEEANSFQTWKKLMKSVEIISSRNNQLLEQSALEISSWRKLIVVKDGISSCLPALEDFVIFSNGAH